MATNSLTDLMSVLAEKVQALESMRFFLEEEERCIIELKPEQLEENTCQAEGLITRLNVANDRFRAHLSRAGAELGIPEAGTLSSLLPGVNPEIRVQLCVLQKKGFSAVTAIKHHLAINERLIKQSLSVIDGSMSLFIRFLGGCETYGATGRISKGKAARGILCREI
jgi:FlgN protein